MSAENKYYSKNAAALSGLSDDVAGDWTLKRLQEEAGEHAGGNHCSGSGCGCDGTCGDACKCRQKNNEA